VAGIGIAIIVVILMAWGTAAWVLYQHWPVWTVGFHALAGVVWLCHSWTNIKVEIRFKNTERV
jgi:hypothetical protein